jgi:hypothetical protein
MTIELILATEWIPNSISKLVYGLDKIKIPSVRIKILKKNNEDFTL